MSENQMVQSRVPWINEQKAFLEMVTEVIQRDKQIFTEILRKVLHISNYSMAGE